MSKTKSIFNEIVKGFKEQLKNTQDPFKGLGRVLPVNGNTNRCYTGFNRFYLSLRSTQLGSDTSVWMTMNQINNVGGRVKKGEKATPVFMWGQTYLFKNGVRVSADSLSQAVTKAKKKFKATTEGDFVKKTPFMKYFSVFEISQTENVVISFEVEKHQHNYQLLLSYCGANYKDGLFPMYDKDDDCIVSASLSEEEKYLMFSPLSEWTAVKKRLDRECDFSEEKLIGKMATAFLCQSTGVEMKEGRTEALIDSWIKKLDKNPYFLYKAASEAERSIDFLIDQVKCNLKKVS